MMGQGQGCKGCPGGQKEGFNSERKLITDFGELSTG